MNDGYNKLDVTHALATNLLLRYFHTATVTNDTLVTDTLVFTAGTLIILNRAENSLAEQTIALRLIGPVVDCFWLQYFAKRTFQNGIRRSKADRDL